GQESQGELKLVPNHHTLAIRYLTEPKDTDSIRVVLDAPQAVDYTLDKAHPLMVNDLTDGRWVRSISLSPDGKYTVLSCQTVEPDGKSHWDYELRDTKSGRLLRKLDYAWGWMPRTSAFLQEVTEGGKRNLYKIDPLTGVRELLTANVPGGHITLAPTEDYLILSVPKKDPRRMPTFTRLSRWTTGNPVSVRADTLPVTTWRAVSPSVSPSVARARG
ncbi:MAG: hypothetical protein IJB28_03670, partial [Bacteroidaceae bacterium]|nr:hypothetical protein [Bacteroidaceae bacterium]